MLPLNCLQKRKAGAALFMSTAALTVLLSFTVPGASTYPLPASKMLKLSFSEKYNSTVPVSLYEDKKDLYNLLCLEDRGLSVNVFEMALKGMEKLVRSAKIQQPILTIADFSKPSYEKRLYVIDLEQEELIFHTWVAHGKNSGATYASSFSNNPRSRKSSLGFFVTGQTYNGNNGYSLKLLGVEPGINSNALQRGIVIHGADYVREDIALNGTLGRSWGCPAVAKDIYIPLINVIKEGSCLFIYHPSNSYAYQSHVIR